jgi:hypothetical protein
VLGEGTSVLDLLKPEELARIERDYATGLPARVILEIFKPHGVRLSEATFRKYVQAGLLPRSKRVGRKGKHRGSTGLYPVDSVRRINAIKKMMAQGHTLEEIRRSFVFFKNQIDCVERDLDEVFTGFESELSGRAFGAQARAGDPAVAAAAARRRPGQGRFEVRKCCDSPSRREARNWSSFLGPAGEPVFNGGTHERGERRAAAAEG